MMIAVKTVNHQVENFASRWSAVDFFLESSDETTQRQSLMLLSSEHVANRELNKNRSKLHQGIIIHIILAN